MTETATPKDTLEGEISHFTQKSMQTLLFEINCAKDL